MKILFSILASAAFLLAASMSAQGDQLLFSSDMSPPGNAGPDFNSDDIPFEWWPGSTGDGVVWMQDADRVKPGNANDYFMQGTQGSEGIGNVTLRSRWFSDFVTDFEPFQGQPYTVTFDIAVSAGATGRIDFRVDQHGIGVNSGIIYNDGFQDLGTEWNGSASSSSAGTSTAGDEWITVTLDGVFSEDLSNLDIFFEPWQFGGGTGDNAAHFAGSYSVDNVEFTAVPEPSTYAMIAGFIALGGCLLRRRFRRNV